MNISSFFEKLRRLTKQEILIKIVDRLRIYARLRILKYKMLSECRNVIGKPIYIGPVLLRGAGKISFAKNVNLGVKTSPYFYSAYSYIEARSANSIIAIGSNVYINNNACIVSEGEGIKIGDNTLIGTNVYIVDSDFHDLNPLYRMNGIAATSPVEIGQNVFIGSNVSVLKGVIIGRNSIIANGSVVTKSIPENVIAGGIPCKVIKVIDKNI